VVGPSGAVYGIDALPGMLAVARRLAPAIDWRDASAEALPFPDGAFDVVVSQFGLMFFSDRLQSLREMLRVLAGGGRLAVAVWDSVDNNPAYADEVDLVQRMAGEEAAEALRAPFVLGDANGMRYLAELAGVSDPGVVTREGKARFPSIGALIEADLRGWLPVMGVHLDEDTIAGILDEAETALAHYVNAQGEAEFDVSAHILSGSKA
jgi:SAM-dependent methyltransferase